MFSIHKRFVNVVMLVMIVASDFDLRRAEKRFPDQPLSSTEEINHVTENF